MSPRAYLQVLIATFLWGTAFPTLKEGLEVMPPIAFAGLRFVLAGILLLGFSFLYRGKDGGINSERPEAPVDWPHVLLIGLCSTAIFYSLFFLGMHKTSASSGAVMDGASPIVSALMAHFILHGDRLTGRKLLAILLAFSGILILAFLKPPGGEISTLGCALIFLGLMVSSIGTILVINYRGRFSLVRLTGTQMCFGGSLQLIASLIFERGPHWSHLAQPRFLLIWFYLSGVSAVAFRIWYGLARQYKLTSLSVFSFLIGLWGALLSICIRKDPVTPQLMIALVLVIGGVILMNTEKTSHERTFAPEEGP